MTLADLIPLLTAVPGLAAIYFLWRRLPAEIKAATAQTGASEANTGGQYIENQNKLLTMFTAESLSKADLLNKFGEIQLRVIGLETANAQCIIDIAAVTRRAELAEASALDYKKLYEDMLVEVKALKLQVQDYPQTVLDLREEVKRLKDTALLLSQTRRTEADTASTLANTANLLASTAAASPPSAVPTDPNALHAGDTVTLEAPPAKPDAAAKE